MIEPNVETLKDKVVLITGAAQGIGKSIATRMAAAGARVALADIKEAEVVKTAAALERTYGEGVVGMKVDVADSREVRAWIGGIGKRWGTIDVLINNAGIQLNQASIELTDEDWRRVLGVNLDGCFYCSREVGKYMLAQRRGVIVNIGSVAERFGLPNRLPYSVSKAGIAAMTRVLAAEWAPHGIRVNAIAPGYIETELVAYALAQGHIHRAEIEAKIPMGRLAVADSIAEVAMFLASEKADYITGQVIYVDGGYSIYK